MKCVAEVRGELGQGLFGQKGKKLVGTLMNKRVQQGNAPGILIHPQKRNHPIGIVVEFAPSVVFPDSGGIDEHDLHELVVQAK